MNKTNKLILKHLICQGFLSLLGEGAIGPLFSEKIKQKLLCLGTKILRQDFVENCMIPKSLSEGKNIVNL